MTLLQPLGIPSDVCVCRHWREDHDPKCTVIENDTDCTCAYFTAEDDDLGYWFTSDPVEDGGYDVI
jgi:hypothetical protein